MMASMAETRLWKGPSYKKRNQTLKGSYLVEEKRQEKGCQALHSPEHPENKPKTYTTSNYELTNERHNYCHTIAGSNGLITFQYPLPPRPRWPVAVRVAGTVPIRRKIATAPHLRARLLQPRGGKGGAHAHRFLDS